MSSHHKAPANLVAFPSLSSSLNALPLATSMQNVSLHPNMYANRAAQSEAKVRAAQYIHLSPLSNRINYLAAKSTHKDCFFVFTSKSSSLHGACPYHKVLCSLDMILTARPIPANIICSLRPIHTHDAETGMSLFALKTGELRTGKANGGVNVQQKSK